MPIRIERHGDLYSAEVTPYLGRGVHSSLEPMSKRALIDVLLGLGCHQTDIGDAFYEADPEWLLREP